jgi:hypothetical protein
MLTEHTGEASHRREVEDIRANTRDTRQRRRRRRVTSIRSRFASRTNIPLRNTRRRIRSSRRDVIARTL